MRAGLKKAETEISTAQGLQGASDGESSALMAEFADRMAAFHKSAAASVKGTEVCMTTRWHTGVTIEPSGSLQPHAA